MVDHGSPHLNHTALHRLFDGLLEKLRESKNAGGVKVTQWLATVAGSGLLLGATATLGADLIVHAKHILFPPGCEDFVSARGNETDRVVLVKEHDEDARPLKRVRQAMEERLQKLGIQFVEACRPLRSVVKDNHLGPSQAAVADIRNRFYASLVVVVDGRSNDQVSLQFWRRQKKQDEPAPSGLYDLNGAAALQSMSSQVSDYLFKSDEAADAPFESQVDILYPFPRQTKNVPETQIAYEKQKRMLKWPLSSDARCELDVRLATAQYHVAPLQVEQKLSEIAKSKCPEQWQAVANAYHGHSCLRASNNQAAQVVRNDRLRCAETYYDAAASGHLNANSEPISAMKAKYGLAYTHFQLFQLNNDAEALRKATEGHWEVKRQIMAMKVPPPPNDLALLEGAVNDLGEWLLRTQQKPADEKGLRPSREVNEQLRNDSSPTESRERRSETAERSQTATPPTPAISKAPAQNPKSAVTVKKKKIKKYKNRKRR